MTDNIGALELPARPGTDGDPALKVVGDYFLAVVNHFAGAHLRALLGETTHAKVIPRDPTDAGAYSDTDLPALFVWRSDSEDLTEIGDDLFESVSAINLALVLGPTNRERRNDRRRDLNPVRKAFAIAALKKRHPSYVHRDDKPEDAPNHGEAVEYGSDVETLAGLSHWKLAQQGVKHQEVTIETPGSSDRDPSDAITCTLDVREYVELSDDDAAPTAFTLNVINNDDPEDVLLLLQGLIDAPEE